MGLRQRMKHKKDILASSIKPKLLCGTVDVLKVTRASSVCSQQCPSSQSYLLNSKAQV